MSKGKYIFETLQCRLEGDLENEAWLKVYPAFLNAIYLVVILTDFYICGF